MDYVAPSTLEDAYRALEAEDALCLAGGQSLVAMMNLGLVAPARLVSLRRIEALRGIAAEPDGGLRIGAMTTHAELAALAPTPGSPPRERGGVPRPSPQAAGGRGPPGPALLAQAARVVAYPAVRAWGTIGGAVAHADPAADYPAALVAADASIEVASVAGNRRIAAREFFRGIFETALAKGEIVTAIHVPAGPPGGGAAYQKLSLVAGDFAILSVAAIVAAHGARGDRRLRPDTAPCRGSRSRRRGAARSRTHASRRKCDPPSDHRASAAYRRKVLPELIRRAVRAAQQ